MWYAAEEKGSIGSQCVAEKFKNQSIPIEAVLQLDQTGFAYNDEPTMWLETGKPVNSELTSYLKKLIDTYVERPVVAALCHGDSDEWSWTDRGFKAARALEADYCNFTRMYQYMHSSEDTIDKLSLSHMMDYLKLAISFAVELAEPKLKKVLEIRQPVVDEISNKEFLQTSGVQRLSPSSAFFTRYFLRRDIRHQEDYLNCLLNFPGKILQNLNFSVQQMLEAGFQYLDYVIDSMAEYSRNVVKECPSYFPSQPINPRRYAPHTAFFNSSLESCPINSISPYPYTVPKISF